MTATTLFLSALITVTLLNASTAVANLEGFERALIGGGGQHRSSHPDGTLSRGLQQLYSDSHLDNRRDDEFDWVLLRRPRINKRLSEFLGGPGKRYSEFLGGPGKRYSEFLGGPGKRYSEFLGGPGKKRYSEFLGGPGKRYSEFLGGPGKRYSEFLGGPGKRAAPAEPVPVFAEQEATMSRR